MPQGLKSNEKSDKNYRINPVGEVAATVKNKQLQRFSAFWKNQIANCNRKKGQI